MEAVRDLSWGSGFQSKVLRLKKRLLLAGALLVVGGAAVGIAHAVIPSGGVINAC